MANHTKDEFTRKWIVENALEICERYDEGVLTLRALHYQLVSIGMTNSIQHYKRVVAAMIEARRDGIIRYSQFSDHDRETIGETNFLDTDLDVSIQTAKAQLRNWITYFSRDRWERQPIVPEVWIEKKALQGVFMPICTRKSVALAPCKGYPSLTFLFEASKRFAETRVNGKIPSILYFGDYDASGEDIPRSIEENLRNDFQIEVVVRRIALMHEQVIDLKLPHAPTKETDSRAVNWDGIGQVELDAVKPEILQEWCNDAIDEVFDFGIYEELEQDTARDLQVYQSQLRDYVNTEL